MTDIDTYVDFITSTPPAHAATPGFWEVRAFDSKDMPHVFWFDDVAKLKDFFTSRNLPEFDYYLGEFQRDKRRGRNIDIPAAYGLYIEFDCGNTGIEPTKELAETLWESMLHDGLGAALVGNSGHGLHFHFKISEPVTQDRWQKLENALQRYAVANLAKYNPDQGAKDYARIMRVLGTVNRKHEPVRSCVYIRAPAVLVLADLEKALAPFMKLPEAPRIKSAARVYSDTKPCPAMERVLEGVPQNWRHDALFTIATFGENAGWSREQTRTAGQKFNQGCEPPKSESFTDGQLNSMFADFDRGNVKHVGCKSEGIFSTVLNHFCPYANDKAACRWMLPETARYEFKAACTRAARRVAI